MQDQKMLDHNLNAMYGLSQGVNENLGAVDNGFIRNLYSMSVEQARAEGRMLTFVMQNLANKRGSIAERGVSAASKAVWDVTKFTPLVGAFGSRTVLEEVAYYRALTMNLPTEDGGKWVAANAYALLMDYLLASSLCYVEVFHSATHVDKFYATRNRFIAGRMAGLEDGDTKKFINYLTPSKEMYEEKKLKALTLKPKKGGYSVTQPRTQLDLGLNIKIIPVFMMTSFAEGISQFLKDKVVQFTYIKDNLQERVLETTLSRGILVDIYGPEFVDTMLAGVDLKFNRGFIKLPEVGISKYDETGVRSLNLARITDIKQLSTVDLRFVDVDFDTILRSFKETVASCRDGHVLMRMHLELTGKEAPAVSLPELRNMITSHIDLAHRVGTTTLLRSLHLYMLEREQIFTTYNGGKPREYTGIVGDLDEDDSFSFGLK